MKSKIVPFACMVFLFLGCTNDSESDLVDNSVPGTNTYTNSIKSIMDNNCISCHGNTTSGGAPMSLTTYQNVKDAVTNKGLIDRISRAQGASGMMPLGGTRLSQSSIDQIVDWKNNGFPQ